MNRSIFVASFALAALSALSACGNADIVAPEPLTVLDTHPGSGALIPGGDTAIAVLFSTAVDQATLASAVAVEQTSAAGVPMSSVPITYQNYNPETFTASYRATSLPASAYFRLTVKKDSVRASSGATLRSDFARLFRTAD